MTGHHLNTSLLPNLFVKNHQLRALTLGLGYGAARQGSDEALWVTSLRAGEKTQVAVTS
jgi:hypothetical protein